MICWRAELSFTGIPANERNDPVEKSWSSTEANANSGAAVKAKCIYWATLDTVWPVSQGK